LIRPCRFGQFGEPRGCGRHNRLRVRNRCRGRISADAHRQTQTQQKCPQRHGSIQWGVITGANLIARRPIAAVPMKKETPLTVFSAGGDFVYPAAGLFV
jgi:hypothetical protein